MFRTGMKNEVLMDAYAEVCNRKNLKTKYEFFLQSICILFFIFLSMFTFAGCNHEFTISGNVSGAIGTLKLTNNGTDEIVINDNGLFIFPKTLTDGESYRVEVVDGSDTSQGHTCAVTGGSNGDGSGTINNASVTSIMVVCVGV